MAASIRVNNPAAVVPGDSVLVSWAGVDNPTPTDWVGIWPTGAADAEGGRNRVVSSYTGGTPAGNIWLPLPSTLAPGVYDVRLNYRDGVTLLAQAALNVVGPVPTAPGVPVGSPARSGLSTAAAGGVVDTAELAANPWLWALGLVLVGRALGLIGRRG